MPQDISSVTGTYNRFNPDNRWESVLFRTGRVAQTSEMNELQSVLASLVGQIGGAVFGNGQIISGLNLTMLAPGGANNITLADGSAFLNGKIYSVTGESFTIPVNQLVTVGIRYKLQAITEVDDPTLANPAVGTRGFGEPGAARIVAVLRWGWVAADATRDGFTGYDFYPIYQVDSGVPILKAPPAQASAITNQIAAYDRDSNGNYIDKGLALTFVRDDGVGNYVYNLTDGRANINGFKVGRNAGGMLVYAKDPDPRNIVTEPHTFVAGVDGNFILYTFLGPVTAINQIIGYKQVTDETVVHGSFAGSVDALANTAVSTVLTVKSVDGVTTYVQGTDYLVVGDTIDWSPSGAEPATGASYHVTYQYVMAPTPVSTGINFVVLTGLVPNSVVLISYTYSLPRVDLIAMNADGTITKVKGVAQPINPQAPSATSNQIAIGVISYDWTNSPSVFNTGIKAMPVYQIQAMQSQLNNMEDAIALLQLATDVNNRSSLAKYGIFTEGFNNNDQRDFGVTQGAYSSNGQLGLPVLGITAVKGDNAATVGTFQMLNYTSVVLVDQPNQTGSIKINPYQSFTPPPALVVLNPAVDHWQDFTDVLVAQGYAFSISDERGFEASRRWIAQYGRGQRYSVTTTTSTQTGLAAVSEGTIHQIPVALNVYGFGPGEHVTLLQFDTVNITPGGLYADANGTVSTYFTIPAGVAAGSKVVTIQGVGGSHGTAIFTGDSTLYIREWTDLTSTVEVKYDPLAETFTLTETRVVLGVNIKFTVIGSGAAVRVQIRTTQDGFPTQTCLAEAYIYPTGASLGWVNATFALPVVLQANQEYAIVILTDDANHELAIASLGGYVSAGEGPVEGWMCVQPYTTGVLLASSNASTWTALQGSDLTFQLIGALFDPTPKVVQMGTVAVTNVTDLKFMSNVLRPDAGCDVQFEAIESGTGLDHKGQEAIRFPLAARITDTLTLRMTLTGDTKLSPIVYQDTQLIVGNQNDNDIYVSDAFQASATFGMTVIFNTIHPGASSVIPYCAIDNGSGTGYVWAALSPISRTQIDNGWYEETWSISGQVGILPYNTTRVKLALSGSPQSRPLCAELRAFTH